MMIRGLLPDSNIVYNSHNRNRWNARLQTGVPGVPNSAEKEKTVKEEFTVKTKKYWAVGLCTAMLVSGLGGSAVLADDSTEANVTIRVAWWGGETTHEAMQNALDAYMENNSGVQIEGEGANYDGYKEKLLTELASGTAPELFKIEPQWVSELGESGYLEDLSQHYDIIDLSAIDETLMQYGLYNGEQIGIPTGYNGMVWVGNKTLMENYGMDAEKQYTFDEILELGTSIHSKNENVYLCSVGQTNCNYILREMLKQKSGNQLIGDDYTPGFTQEELQECFEWFAEAFENGVFEPMGDAELYANNFGENPLWVSNSIVAEYTWLPAIVAFRATLDESTTTVPLYGFTIGEDAKNGATNLRPDGLFAVPKGLGQEKMEETLKLASYLFTDAEAGALLGDAFSIPNNDAQKEAAEAAGKLDEQIVKGAEMAAETAGMVENAQSSNDEISNITSDWLAQVCYGEKTPEDAAQKCYEELENKAAKLAE